MTWMEWYDSLAKPSRTPAPATIGLIWRILYPVILLSFGFVFVQASRKKVPWLVALPFAINLVANLIFTPIQFGLRHLPLASLDILVVWGSLVWAMVAIWPRHRWVAAAQVPHLVWVSVATVLQLSIGDDLGAGMSTIQPAGQGTVRAAVVQAAPALYDAPRTLQKLADLSSDAASRGAGVVVFPEAFVGGYPKGHDFGVSLGVRTPAGREEFRRYFERAVEVPGPATERIGGAARDHADDEVYGVVERAGGTLYCTALIFGPDGSLLGKHRKLMPTALERVIWGCGDGSTLPVVPTPLGKVGAVICWENCMPLLRTAMYAKGVELYCAVTVDDRETWVPTMRHVALEGRCLVLSACQLLRRADLPAGYPAQGLGASQDVLIRGGSCVVGPLGGLLAGPVYSEECVLTADLDRADLARAKFDFDAVGHYARPDVFRLHVNEQPMRPVVFGAGSPPEPAAPAHRLRLLEFGGSFAVCKLPPGASVPAWATAGGLSSVTRTGDELSVVCVEGAVPEGVVSEKGWRCLRVADSMPFTLVGVLAALTTPVARAGVGVFASSTFDTDYLLVKAAEFDRAVAALRGAGHGVEVSE